MPRKSRPKSLPSKPSELLRLAVADACKLQKTPGFRLNMREWVYTVDGTCHVCMVGAVMVCELGVEGCADPRDFADDVYDKLRMINSLRTGLFNYTGADADKREAALQFNTYVAPKIQQFPDGLRAPWPVYLRGAEILERVGL